MTPVLVLRELSVEFPTREKALTALNKVSLSIGQGEVVGVVGESGAGKSVMGGAIIGLLEAPGRLAGGEVWLNGRRIDQFTEDQMRSVRGREIGSIFQDPLTALDPLYTIGDQLIETILTHLGLTWSQAREHAIALLEATGIPAASERLNQFPHQFSGGMRQRVVIALALAAQPKLIIADELTTALDVSIQAQIIAMLKKLCREQGTAMMLITHDMGVIAQIAHRVLVMYAGRVVEEGSVSDLINAPQHPYTVGLMQSIPSTRHQVHRLRQIDGAMPRLNAIPNGCAFNPRCTKAINACRSSSPALFVTQRSRAACWLVQDV